MVEYQKELAAAVEASILVVLLEYFLEMQHHPQLKQEVAELEAMQQFKLGTILLAEAGGGGWFGGGGGHSSPGGGGSGHVGTPITSGNGVIARTLAGNESMPDPNGGTMTGNTGNGFVRIRTVSGL